MHLKPPAIYWNKRKNKNGDNIITIINSYTIEWNKACIYLLGGIVGEN